LKSRDGDATQPVQDLPLGLVPGEEAAISIEIREAELAETSRQAPAHLAADPAKSPPAEVKAGQRPAQELDAGAVVQGRVR
jgi:hypothetical protein